MLVQIFYATPKIYLHIVAVTNILCQPKKGFAFNIIGFCASTKVFGEALNAVKFFGWVKKFGPAQNILGAVKGKGIRAYCPNIYIQCHRPADRIDGNNKLWQVMWSRYEISTDNEFRPPNGMSAAMRVRDKKKMSALRQLGQRPLDSLLLSKVI